MSSYFLPKNRGVSSYPIKNGNQCEFLLAQLSKCNLPSHKLPAWVNIEKEILKPFRTDTFFNHNLVDLPEPLTLF